MTATQLTLTAIATLAAAVFILLYLLLAPGPVRLTLRRRRPNVAPARTLLNRSAAAATSAVDRFLRQRGNAGAGNEALEQAGIKMRLQDFTVMLIIGTVVAGALGALLAGPLLALVFAILVPVLAKIILGVRTGRRQRAFADQLEDSLQLMSSSLRAGHSVLQALNSVAREAEEPTSVEFARVINEIRVGRSSGDALEQTAQRMRSEDFTWVTQAMAINREIGGNLAEVLDKVGETIRERNQIRRQVKSLSAEGTMSAWVLMALPVCIAAFLTLTNRAFISAFTESLLGYAMIGASVLLFIVGGVWMRKTVRIKF